MPTDEFKNKATKVAREVTGVTMSTADIVENGVKRTVREADTYISPIRDNVFKRYPILFSLLVTFGLVATFLGIEQILLQFDILRVHPWYILSIGIIILALTGTLYKKLK